MPDTPTDLHDERESYLEAVNRASIQALHLVLEMGRHGTSLNRIATPTVILREVQTKLDQLIPWQAAAFYLMDERNSDLSLSFCNPEQAEPRIVSVFERLVEDRTLSLVLQRSDSFFTCVDGYEVLLHAMNTASRCRGVFLGIPDIRRKAIPDASLAIFSIMMQAAAHTLESYELYRLVREVNCELEEKVVRLEQEMAERKDFQRRLLDSQQMLRVVLDTIPQSVFWKDNESVYLGCNSNFASLINLDMPEEVAGKCDADLFWRKNAADNHRTAELQVIREGRSRLGISERLIRSDGSEILLESNIVPLRDVEGEVIGVLGCIQDITERIRYQEQLAFISMHDPLTGLPNRTLLMERMDRAIQRGLRRKNYHYALLMIDIDRFKQINDSMGHQYGDNILGMIARRIGKCLRGMDTIARLGGDDFAVLLEELSSPREALIIARRLFHVIEQPEVIDGRELMLTASGGLLVKTKPYEKADDLLRDAEIALQCAAERGGAGFRVFTPSMLHRAMHVANLEYELRRGLAHGELFVQYQPIYVLNQEQLIGFEALARWKHPLRGMVSPAEFIPIAERTGIIQELGNWVLREACGTMAHWQSVFPQAQSLFMSVNLSGRQMAQPNLTDTVRSVLEETGLPPSSLKLEITESAIMENADLALITLQELKNLGISLAIDDFGTGYSSLAYLQRFPVDTLKIDRTFVAALDHHDGQQIARAVMALAQSLKLTVVAEGVEKRHQIDSLRGMRCQYVQGFFYSKPLDVLVVPDLFLPSAPGRICSHPTT